MFGNIGTLSYLRWSYLIYQSDDQDLHKHKGCYKFCVHELLLRYIHMLQVQVESLQAYFYEELLAQRLFRYRFELDQTYQDIIYLITH